LTAGDVDGPALGGKVAAGEEMKALLGMKRHGVGLFVDKMAHVRHVGRQALPHG